MCVRLFADTDALQHDLLRAAGRRLLIMSGAHPGFDLEATAGIEPAIRVLQTPALPLGYVAPGRGRAR